ncbi:MAG: hypothetical protein HW421_552 [Ignavibacteria bacterium]|nr:hypothetical protein [Ignavibacteria bacterium]
MIAEGIDKAKTMENTVFLTNKDVAWWDDALIQQQHKLYDVTLKNLDYDKYNEVISLVLEYDLEHSYREKVEAWCLPKELCHYTKSTSITFRKSAKSEE